MNKNEMLHCRYTHIKSIEMLKENEKKLIPIFLSVVLIVHGLLLNTLTSPKWYYAKSCYCFIHTLYIFLVICVVQSRIGVKSQITALHYLFFFLKSFVLQHLEKILLHHIKHVHIRLCVCLCVCILYAYKTNIANTFDWGRRMTNRETMNASYVAKFV